SGDIAVGVGVAGGAEDVLVSDTGTDLEALAGGVGLGWQRGKGSSIVVVAEGGEPGRVFRLAEEVRQLTQLEPRVGVLGHIQRGGTPTARDRILASKLGAAAVDIVLEGGGALAAEVCGNVARVPLGDTWGERRELAADLLVLVRALTRRTCTPLPPSAPIWYPAACPSPGRWLVLPGPCASCATDSASRTSSARSGSTCTGPSAG